MTGAPGRHPTRTSTAVVVLVSLAAAFALAGAADVRWPALLGSLAAVTLVVSVWAAGWDRHRTAGTALASLLALPVGLGIVAATLGTVLVLAGALFPVPTAAQLPAAVVGLIARVMVVVGATGAVFGAVASTRGVVETDRLRLASNASLRTALPSFAAATLLAVAGIVGQLAATGQGPAAVLGRLIRLVTSLFVRPDPLGPHFATFALTIGVTLLVARRAVGDLPLTELATETATGPDLVTAVERVRRALALAGLAALLAVPPVGAAHLTTPPQELRALLTPTVYDLLAAVTASPAVRTLAWFVTGLGLAVVAGVWLLRTAARTAPERVGSVLAPFAGGTVVLLAAVLAAEPVLSAAVAWVASKLPGQFSDQFLTIATDVTSAYGAVALVAGMAAVVLLLTAASVGTVWIAVRAGFVEVGTAGVAIASLSLFQAAAFAGVLEVSAWLVLAGLVAAVLVWDVGEFGATLGEEVGRAARTRRSELVHATGTLAVGGLGAGVAVLVAGQTDGVVSAGVGPVAVALISVLVGLVLLVVTLR